MGIRLWVVPAAVAACLLLACSAPGTPKVGENMLPVWPLPPDQPRFAYETVLRNSQSVARESDESRLRRALTGGPEDLRVIRKPLGVAARGGRIFVSDTEGRRIHVFDVPRRRFYTFGYRAEGELQKPAGLSVDARGNVYVCDVSARRVIKFDGLGLYLGDIGRRGELERPTGVGVSPAGDRVYVVDAGGIESDAHQVVIFDGDGRRLRTLGPRGAEPGRFNLPVDAAVAPDGTLYVLDAGNFRVQAFDRDGRFLHAFGTVGTSPGQFSRPRGIATDRDGNVYVSDAGFANVQAFDPQGRLLLALGGRGTEDAPGRYRLPAGIAGDETGRVYIVDQYFHKIEVLRRLSDAEGQAMLAGASRR